MVVKRNISVTSQTTLFVKKCNVSDDEFMVFKKGLRTSFTKDLKQVVTVAKIACVRTRLKKLPRLIVLLQCLFWDLEQMLFYN